jgi:hypothetical protein
LEKHLLSKSTFIRGDQCLKSLYLHTKRPFLRDKLSPEQLARFRRGTKIGQIAQKLFPGGVDLRPRSYKQYEKKLQETLDIINTGKHSVLYEAGFQYDRLLIFLDILVKENSGWIAYEVKSSKKISRTFLLDAAFQYYVITHAGVDLHDFYIIYVNENFTFSEPFSIDDLFVKQSVLKEILGLQEYVEKQVAIEKEVLEYSKSPDIAPGKQCTDPYPCDFIGHCWKKIPKEEWPVIEHPREDFYDFVEKALESIADNAS